MDEALKTMVPLIAFMLIPIWIPIIAVAVGAVADRLAALRGSSKDACPPRPSRPGSSPSTSRSTPPRSSSAALPDLATRSGGFDRRLGLSPASAPPCSGSSAR